MSIVMAEKYLGRSGNRLKRTLEFQVRGSDNDSLIRQHVENNAPFSHDGLVFNSITAIKQVASEIWLVSVDYGALDVVRFYLVYRAMVRAKVTWLNPSNRSFEARKKYQVEGSEDPFAGPWDKYLTAASYFAFDLKSKLAITHGFSGSGKSTFALQVMQEEGWVRLRSDVERQRLAKKFKTNEKYSTEMTDWVYAHLLELARMAIDADMPIIVDATFLKSKRRAQFEWLARELNLEFRILTCDAPFDELCRRLRERGPDPSDATVDVLKHQMETHDPLTTEELRHVRNGRSKST